ncbi:hypothetical protein TNCT_338821 [Trichonephila clavata]|uniref:Uncharacterized protein n=1 Tax=Trichonephila clavata TaxID=2740835 RepID=A0A8X6G262_TRICU|nr:hypothetical protein TNCT_338821 [Trichonephila clavata]
MEKEVKQWLDAFKPPPGKIHLVTESCLLLLFILHLRFLYEKFPVKMFEVKFIALKVAESFMEALDECMERSRKRLYYFAIVYISAMVMGGSFVEKYVLNLPVGTRFELQDRDWNDRIVRIEFVRTETGFLYQGEASNEGGQAFMSHYVLEEGIITPDAWLDLVMYSYFYPCIRPFYDMKIHLAQASVRIWTSRDQTERWINEESFSTVAFLEMNRTRYPRIEGKRVLTSLMDLSPVLNERTEESLNQRVE